MLRTEYHGQSEHIISLALPRRREGEDDDNVGTGITSAQSIVLYGTPIHHDKHISFPNNQMSILGTVDGSLVQVLALTDTTFKRLSLLQGQLVRNIQHIAGLNPRANR